MFETIHLIKTNGRHGYEDEIVTILGDACGVIMQYEYEKTLYIAGDTVWCDEVDKAISKYSPHIIIVNAGANSVIDKRLIMGKEDVLKVHKAYPSARIWKVLIIGYFLDQNYDYFQKKIDLKDSYLFQMMEKH